MKKLLITILLILAITFSACGSNIPTEQETIKIGAIYTLSGFLTFIGDGLHKGTILAVEEINAQGGVNGRLLEVIYEDNKGTPAEAVTAAKKLIEIDDVDYIFSDYTSTTLAIAPLVKESNKFMFYLSSVNPEISKEGEYIFKGHFNIDDSCSVLADEIINNRNLKSVGILRSEEEWNSPCIPVFEKKLTEAGIEVVKENFVPQESDLRVNILKLKEKNVEGIFILSFSNTMDNILKQLDTLYEPKLVILSYAGDVAAQTEFNLDYFSRVPTIGFHPVLVGDKKSDEFLNNFIKTYTEKYGKEPDYNAADTYEAVYWLVEAMKECDDPLNYDCVANQLKSKTYKGLFGETTFDENGVSKRDPTIIEYVDGEWKLI